MKVDDIVYPNQNNSPNPEWDYINYLDTSGIINNVISNIQKIKKGNYPLRAKRVVKKDNIIISTVRPNQCHYGIIKELAENMVVSTGFTVLEAKDNVIPEYLYYYLTQQNITKRLNDIADGATTSYPSINPQDILDIKIDLPKESIQRKVAYILSTIDSKIYLNNKINLELDQMAKTLYNYWFVQFDFPDEDGKPYKASGGRMEYNEILKREIPKEWEIKSIKDFSPILTGKQDANFATANGKYAFFTCSNDILSCDEYEFEGKAILLAGNGDFNLKCYNGRFNAYQRTYVLIPTNELYYTVLYFAISDKITKLTKGSRGSIVKFITMGDIESIGLAIPKKGLENLFLQLNTITEMISKNNQQNQKLTQLRDFLLPLLMNGQVKVN